MEKKLTSIKKANPHQDLIQARKESMKKINESNEKSFEWLNEKTVLLNTLIDWMISCRSLLEIIPEVSKSSAFEQG